VLGWTTPQQLADDVKPTVTRLAVDSVIGTDTEAQQAVATGMLLAHGVSPSAASGARGAQGSRRPDGPSGGVAPGTPGYSAAQRFAALPADTRRAWLVANLSALRVGHLTLEQLP
jgi:hypothetical protein